MCVYYGTFTLEPPLFTIIERKLLIQELFDVVSGFEALKNERG